MRRTANHEPRTTRNGFTLMELMIALAIFTIVSGIAFTALRVNETFRDLIFIRVHLYRENKRAHDAIAEELEKSQGARVAITDNTSPVPDEIRFQIPLIDSIGEDYTIPWGATFPGDPPYNGNWIRYRLKNGTNLVREVLNNDPAYSPVPGKEQIKNVNIADLQFSTVGGNVNHISINTTARKTPITGTQAVEDSLESTVYLLN